MKRPFLLTAIVAAASVLGISPTAEAQEIQLTGPLKGAPAVRHLRLYREGRFNIAPAVSFTLLDEYRRTIMAGASASYNIKDWLSIGAWGAFGAVSMTTDLTDKIDGASPRDPLTALNVNHSNFPSGGAAPFADQTAKLSWVFVPQITFIPFRGKLAIFNKIFVDSDFYVSWGPAFVGIKERNSCAATPATPKGCADPNSFGLQSQTKFLWWGAPGLGFTFYPGQTVSLGVEYRALPFSWNRAGFDSRGGGTNGNFPDGKIDSNDETFKWNQMITIAVGFALPTKAKVSD